MGKVYILNDSGFTEIVDENEEINLRVFFIALEDDEGEEYTTDILFADNDNDEFESFTLPKVGFVDNKYLYSTPHRIIKKIGETTPTPTPTGTPTPTPTPTPPRVRPEDENVITTAMYDNSDPTIEENRGPYYVPWKKTSMELYKKTKQDDTDMFAKTRYLGVEGYIPGSTIGNIPTKDKTKEEDVDKNEK